jgi:hypothetical protein
MIINLYRDRPSVIAGTRVIESPQTDSYVGVRIQDPYETGRIWDIRAAYWPVEGRVLGGIRVKLVDQKGFITFCNQRDLEVMLGEARPGAYCPWSGSTYLGPEDEGWCGFCCDEEDLIDDLYDQELFLRAQCGGVLAPVVLVSQPDGTTYAQYTGIVRSVHLDKRDDHEEHFVLLDHQLCYPETDMPDSRFETVERRWMRSERRRVRWDRS